MQKEFKPQALPLLIGSIPMRDHAQATDLVLEHTPQIPLWVQLPALPQEGMLSQFLPGLPGYRQQNGSEYVDTGSQDYDQELLSFYQDYMAVTEAGQALEQSRFKLDEQRAKGFFVLLQKLQGSAQALQGVKGQITGPITFATGVKDQEKKAIFYDEQLRDASVKLLALKAAWQVEQLQGLGKQVIMFFDEPALAGFGSSEFISISKQDVQTCFAEVIEQVHARQGLAGIHVCANADWSLILESGADILSFDAYSYFDKLLLYSRELQDFLQRGGIIAWGIVPTLEPEDIEKESVDSLFSQFQHKLQQLQEAGLAKDKILERSLITPSCGTGSLSLEQASKVMQLTRDLSSRVRAELM
ncbi:MAG: hypothetical protein ACQEQX_09570 [Thermodesulfobacteriota bacterium]